VVVIHPADFGIGSSVVLAGHGHFLSPRLPAGYSAVIQNSLGSMSIENDKSFHQPIVRLTVHSNRSSLNLFIYLLNLNGNEIKSIKHAKP